MSKKASSEQSSECSIFFQKTEKRYYFRNNLLTFEDVFFIKNDTYATRCCIKQAKSSFSINEFLQQFVINVNIVK